MRLSATLRPVTRLMGSLGVATITSFGDATAEAADILLGETAYIATGKVTGTCTFDADTSDADAVESDILLGKTAYVDGEKKTGTSTLNADTTDATLTANDMLYGVTGYGADGTKLTGAGAYWQYVGSLENVFGTEIWPETVEIHAANCVSIKSALSQQYNIPKYLTLTLKNGVGINMYGVSMVGSAIVTLTFTNPITIVSNLYRGFESSTLVGIYGELDFSVCTLIGFNGSKNLRDITITASSFKISLSFASSPLLSTASLLSIANGLDSAVAPKTLTMHATAKTNMLAINVDNNAGVAVLGSAMTLTAFITGVKGWTIA